VVYTTPLLILRNLLSRPAPQTHSDKTFKRQVASHSEVSTDGVRSEIPEAEWISRLIDRDDQAWDLFFERYQSLIANRIHAAFSELGRPWQQDLSEEIAAEAIYVLLRDGARTLRLFRGRSRFSTWLSTIVRRTALAMILRNAQSRHLSSGDEDWEIKLLDTPANWKGEVQSDQAERLALLKKCLRHLSVEDQQILKWHYFDRASYLDISQRLCIRENSVGPKLSRARKRLERLIRKQGDHRNRVERTSRASSKETLQ